jgi:hypothetical protein
MVCAHIQVPFASALTPLVEGIIATDLKRFRDIVADGSEQQVVG